MTKLKDFTFAMIGTTALAIEMVATDCSYRLKRWRRRWNPITKGRPDLKLYHQDRPSA